MKKGIEQDVVAIKEISNETLPMTQISEKGCILAVIMILKSNVYQRHSSQRPFGGSEIIAVMPFFHVDLHYFGYS